jgi:hypothetical protein
VRVERRTLVTARSIVIEVRERARLPGGVSVPDVEHTVGSDKETSPSRP